jgi:xanthine/CO dehydrogenase XdhC/CoxF family maturation factor
MATIVNAVGFVPSQATAKLLLRADGTIVGTVGSGASEAAVIKESPFSICARIRAWTSAWCAAAA